MEVEIWKDIKGFEGFYQASSLGRIKSLNRVIIRRGVETNIYEKILKPSVKSGGYNTISLCKGKEYKLTLHRIIAELFIPKVSGKLEVNHKNGIKTDNRADNLEWCNRSENVQHAYKIGLNKGIKGCDNRKAGIYLNKETGIFYISSIEAINSLGKKIPKSTFISMTNNSCRNNTSFIKI